MSDAHAAVDASISELEQLRKVLKRKSTRQVRSSDEIVLVRATALAWFNSHRPTVISIVDEQYVEQVDIEYRGLIAASDKATTRDSYFSIIKSLKQNLSQLRMLSVSSPVAPSSPTTTSDTPPDFSPLIHDPKMRTILEKRWAECSKCVSSGAPLSATVMMGGLLEALLLARVNIESDKSKVFTATNAPVSHKTKKPLPLSDWTLRNYLDVAHELTWISRSAKDIGAVLRDYRNYIHPFKELSHGITLSDSDATLFWEISKSVSRQLITHGSVT